MGNSSIEKTSYDVPQNGTFEIIDFLYGVEVVAYWSDNNGLNITSGLSNEDILSLLDGEAKEAFILALKWQESLDKMSKDWEDGDWEDEDYNYIVYARDFRV